MGQVLIPFGSQYYRAPTPLRSEWAKDLKNIAAAGLNTIKIWAQWRWNNPVEGQYYFDDLDEIMHLAEANGLKVVINAIFNVAPAWFSKKYPDSVMISQDGRRREPTATEARQIGGAPGPCLHHKEGQRGREDFLREVVKRYAGHPALELWDLWNEPELTCGIWREPTLENIVCYCDESVAEFKKWLAAKYGELEAVNRRWSRNYSSWDQIEVPRLARTFCDMIDWRLFFADTVTEELARRVQVVKEIDAEHPVMVHTVPMPYFNMITCASDDYQLARHCDLFGNSVGSHPFAAALSKSSAPGKKVINAEIHMHCGTPFNRTPLPTFGEFKRHILIPLARGIKGFLFWQYRPERIGLESPMWGMTDLDGNSTVKLEYASRVNKALQDNVELIAAAKPVDAKVAIVNGKANQLFDWCDDQDVNRYYKSVHGAFMALYRRGIIVDIISSDQILDDNIGQYDVIYYPSPYYMEDRIAEILKRWVADGGTLIGEVCFAGYRASTGMHETVIPGMGFDEVFGVREADILTSSTYLTSYSRKWGAEHLEKDLWVIVVDTDDLATIGSGLEALGYFFREGLAPTTAEILAHFADGAPAITKNSFGKGCAIMVGTLLAHTCSDGRIEGSQRLVASLVELGGVKPIVEADTVGVRADILTKDKQAIMVVTNEDRQKKQVRLEIDTGIVGLAGVSELVDLLTGGTAQLTHKAAKAVCTLKLEPLTAELFAIR